ncbi:UNVERIFIED_CONTAM: hypothetical protein GTU68_065534 [Idotea baltica]|nr:hypothetical protein [Idotea baltica]
MENKKLPFDLKVLEEIAKEYPTPFYVYDEANIVKTCKELYSAFSWAKGYKNFFAVKATPNPYLLELLKENNLGADCSSSNEIILSKKVGFNAEDIVFTSNNTTVEEFKLAIDAGALINFDDISHIEILSNEMELPKFISCRYNPGDSKAGNVIIGKPEEAKFGFRKEQLFKAYKMLKEKGVERFGLHAMVASNELDEEYFADTARMLFELVGEIKKELEIEIETVNLGGGLGIPYKPEEKAIDLQKLGSLIKEMYETKITPLNLKNNLRVVMENGRFITGPNGYLVTKCINHKSIYRDYIGVDANMANLMRPGMYGAYHYISAPGKENVKELKEFDVVGSLCENNDKFAINRMLPEVNRGDFLVIHDAGAHGHSMGFQYNGKLRCAELLLKTDGSIQKIRRAETPSDYFATLDDGKYSSLAS